jgi:hypothetical protein
MGRSSEAWSNLTLPARFVKPEPASTTGTVGRVRTAGHDFQHHPATVVAACWLRPTVPIALREFCGVG